MPIRRESGSKKVAPVAHVLSALPSPVSAAQPPGAVSLSPGDWAAQRRARIEAAEKLREQRRDGLTDDHTFQPRRIAKAPPRGCSPASVRNVVTPDARAIRSLASPAVRGSSTSSPDLHAVAKATPKIRPPRLSVASSMSCMPYKAMGPAVSKSLDAPKIQHQSSQIDASLPRRGRAESVCHGRAESACRGRTESRGREENSGRVCAGVLSRRLLDQPQNASHETADRKCSMVDDAKSKPATCLEIESPCELVGDELPAWGSTIGEGVECHSPSNSAMLTLKGDSELIFAGACESPVGASGELHYVLEAACAEVASHPRLDCGSVGCDPLDLSGGSGAEASGIDNEEPQLEACFFDRSLGGESKLVCITSECTWRGDALPVSQ